MPLNAIFDNVHGGLLSLLKGGLAERAFSAAEIADACRAEIEAEPTARQPIMLTPASQALLRKIADSSDADLLQVASKMLKSARLAALTHKDPDPAPYEDQPFVLDFDPKK